MRLLALTPFRNEMRFLPGLLRTLEGQVDGIVGLDDGSSDGSGEFVRNHPLVLDVIRAEPGQHGENEDNRLHETLTRAAWAFEPDWLLGIDADERLEKRFRRVAERGVRDAQSQGANAIWVPFREMWRPHAYRVDGVWGQKRKACLFRASPGHLFDQRRLHGWWASMDQDHSLWPGLDSAIYHLRMLEPQDRIRRVETYRRLDPERTYQAIGYDYLVDETGLSLRRVPWRRRYRT